MILVNVVLIILIFLLLILLGNSSETHRHRNFTILFVLCVIMLVINNWMPKILMVI